jgi:hypothetical protein
MTISRRNMIRIMAGTAPAAALPKTFSRASPAWATPFGAAEDPAFADHRKYNFNAQWKVLTGDPAGASDPGFDDGKWTQRTLPWAWNEDDAFCKDIRNLSTGIAWYRKHFKVPASWKGKKIFFECEGIRQAGDFYLNGKHVGLSENGVMAFGFDLTDAVRFGEEENVLAARIDNSWDYREKATHTRFQWQDRNFYANYGGINKNVYLHVLPRVYQTLPLYANLGTTGTYVYADGFDIPGRSAVIHTESEVRNEEDTPQQVQYVVAVRDMEGKEVARFQGDKARVAPGATTTLKASLRVGGLHFWSWGYGYLYDVQTLLEINGKPVDSVTTRTGFRKTEFKNGMIYLNDRVIQVHGYGQRTTNEWPAIGLSVPAWLSDYSNGLMVEGNANLVRWMHVTPWKQDVESCDRVGLMQSMPAGDSEGDVTGTRWEQRKALMQEAIIYNRNNPSIIFYECGNKGIRDSQMQEMKDIRDRYDPHGGRAIGAREMLASQVAEYGGEMLYIDKSATKPLWAMEYSRDEGMRKYWDDYSAPYHKDGDGPPYKGESAAVYNRNMDSHAVEDVKRWYDYWEARPGTGRRVSSGGVNIIFSDTNTHHRGAANYRCSGEVDAMRIKKQNFFADRAMWDGWVEVQKDHIHIIGHWNYYRGVTKDVYVVSSADKVTLSLNGKLLAPGEKSHRFLYTFKDVGWQPGMLRATGYDEDGKEVCSTGVRTAERPAAIRLTEVARPVPFQADGHDLALVEVEVTDAKGQRCPLALNMIHFTLDGPAEWRGGIAKGPDNFILYKDLPVEGGVNRVLIRSATRPGLITVHAAADGLKSAMLTLRSRPFATTDGLAAALPSRGLPCRLERGATPSRPSYTVTRIPVAIAGVTAGANSDKAAASYDDDETTAWENDGRLSTAWISYRLEREATVSEVVLKLNRFRTKAYPLIITVDGQVVFKGTTARTLGYYTAVCMPVKGKNVKIQLAGFSRDEGDGYGKEVSGKTLGDGVGTDTGAKGTLSIIEAEIYEAVK